jgi:predicted NACHT family NTPase
MTLDHNPDIPGTSSRSQPVRDNANHLGGDGNRSVQGDDNYSVLGYENNVNCPVVQIGTVQIINNNQQDKSDKDDKLKSSNGGEAELDPPIELLVQEVRSQLHDKIQNNYSTIRVLNVAHPIQLGHLYVDINLLSSPNHYSESSIEGLLANKDPQKDFNRLGMPEYEERISGMKAVKGFRHLMVLGRPGTGKTTFLHHVAITCNQGGLLPDFVPLLIRLRDIMPREGEKWSLSAAIVSELGDKTKANTLLEKGKILLLLDGLDEVPDGEIDNAIGEIEKFKKSYWNNRLIVTCRLQAQPYQFFQFDYVEVAEFTPEQIQQFVTNWFSLASQQGQGNNKAEGFITRLNSHKQIEDIVATPILLSLACKVFNDDETFYSKPGKLYQKGLELLLSEWNEASRIKQSIYKDFDVPKKRDLLGEVALEKFKQSQFVLFKQDELEALIADYLRDRKSFIPSDVIGNRSAKDVLLDIAEQHGLLIERASKIWSFSHLTFQEYFAAEAISKLDYSMQGEAHNQILAYVTKQNWREVFFLTSEISADADSLVLSIKKFADSLLANNSKLQEVLKWLDRKSENIDSAHENVAVRALYLARFLTPASSLTNDEVVNKKFSNFRSLSSALDPKISNSPDPDLTLDRIVYYLLSATVSYDKRKTLTYIDSVLKMAKIDREFRSRLLRVKDCLKQYQRARYVALPLLSEFLVQERDILLSDFLMRKRDSLPGHKYSYEDIDLLSQYYVANDTLVYCISSSNVSDRVRQEIKETLLLPISEHQ